MGGIKNALERGETLSKTKQSFLNAGYTEVEIRSAVQRMSASGVQIAKPLTQQPSQPGSPPQAFAPQAQAPPQEQSSAGLIVVLAVIGVLILLSALLLGLFWDKIAPFFDKIASLFNKLL